MALKKREDKPTQMTPTPDYAAWNAKYPNVGYEKMPGADPTQYNPKVSVRDDGMYVYDTGKNAYTITKKEYESGISASGIKTPTMQRLLQEESQLKQQATQAVELKKAAAEATTEQNLLAEEAKRQELDVPQETGGEQPIQQVEQPSQTFEQDIARLRATTDETIAAGKGIVKAGLAGSAVLVGAAAVLAGGAVLAGVLGGGAAAAAVTSPAAAIATSSVATTTATGLFHLSTLKIIFGASVSKILIDKQLMTSQNVLIEDIAMLNAANAAIMTNDMQYDDVVELYIQKEKEIAAMENRIHWMSVTKSWVIDPLGSTDTLVKFKDARELTIPRLKLERERIKLESQVQAQADVQAQTKATYGQ